jgi:hypothetical protein
VRAAEQREAERDAKAPTPPQPRDWSRDIQARQDSIKRAYLGHADELAKGDAADRRLAGDIKRFVADMPVPLTRRQALTVELRQVLDQHPGRGAPTPASGAERGDAALHRAKSAHASEPNLSQVPNLKPRR